MNAPSALPFHASGKASALMSHPVELDQYDEFLREVKQRIATARVRAAFAVNAELVALYWQIGRLILERQERHGWGGKVIHRLSVDLRTAFPGTKGFSRSNLHYARKVAEWYPETGFVQQPVGQIPWGHLVLLLDKAGDAKTALWYAQRTLEHGWSRNVLAHQIRNRLMERQGKALTNFDRSLPPHQSDLAHEALKSPYTFEFLGLDEQANEQTLESALTERIQRFLLELGRGFAFVGRQYRLEVGGDECFIDLLFYHLSLRCFIVVGGSSPRRTSARSRSTGPQSTASCGIQMTSPRSV
jgi:predicted nuclease of restriction endonuclease-like (RecB) superfamily